MIQPSSPSSHPDASPATFAADPGTAAATLETMRVHFASDRAVLRAIAGNPAAAPQTLDALARDTRLVDGLWDVQLAVASNPAAPESARKRLLGSPWHSVRAAATGRATTAPVQQAALAIAADAAMLRFALAGNPAAAPELLRLVATWSRRCFDGPDRWAAGVACSNPALPADVVGQLTALATLPPWVARRIAAHPACPPAQAERLRDAFDRGDLGPGDVWFDPVTCDRNPHDATQPLSVFLERYPPVGEREVDHPLWPVRCRAVTRSDRTFDELRQLARDAHTAVRLEVVRCRTLPVPELGVLAGDADPEIRWIAQQRLAATPGAVATLVPPGPQSTARVWARRAALAGVLVAAVIATFVEPLVSERLFPSPQGPPTPAVETVAGRSMGADLGEDRLSLSKPGGQVVLFVEGPEPGMAPTVEVVDAAVFLGGVWQACEVLNTDVGLRRILAARCAAEDDPRWRMRVDVVDREGRMITLDADQRGFVRPR